MKRLHFSEVLTDKTDIQQLYCTVISVVVGITAVHNYLTAYATITVVFKSLVFSCRAWFSSFGTSRPRQQTTSEQWWFVWRI